MIRNTRGVTRTVFLIGRWAIKVPTGRHGWPEWVDGLRANLREIERAKYAHLKPFVCPILWAAPLGLAIVMPRVGIIERDLTDPEHAHFFPLCFPLVEHKPDSFGYFGNRLVAVDFGAP